MAHTFIYVWKGFVIIRQRNRARTHKGVHLVRRGQRGFRISNMRIRSGRKDRRMKKNQAWESQGQQGKKKTPLPPGIETCLEDSKVQCEICVRYNSSANSAEWITLKVFKSSHPKSAIHLQAVSMKERDEAEQARRLQDAPDFFAASNNLDFTAPQSPQVLQHPLSQNPMQDLWGGFDGTFGLDDGMDEAHKTARKKFDNEVHKYGLWDGLEQISTDTNMINMEQLWDEEEQDDLLLELLKNIMRISGSFMKVLLWLLCELGIKEVPLFEALRKVQKSLHQKQGIPTINYKTPKANAFSFNNPQVLVANDWANPLKWRKDLDCKCLSPMYNAGDDLHYSVDEPASLSDDKIVIPVRWLEDEKGDILSIIGNKGNPLYTSFINIFGDDVSGNQSKSWNKHWNVYMNHQNLPRKLLYQQYNTHFISTSTHASVPEQFRGIKEKIEYTATVCLVTTHHKPRLLVTLVAKGTIRVKNVRVGGSQREKETDKGFHEMFTSGEAHSLEQTLKFVKAQVRAACLAVAQAVKDMQTETGVKDAFTQHWINNLIEHMIYNPFLKLKGFDASIDTPVEILHTILLGIVKYVWHSSHTSWNATQKKMYSNRLQALDLKTLVQLNTFHVYDLVSKPQFEFTKAIGELSAILWQVEICKQYLSDIKVAAANVLNIAAELDPSKIIAKLKYHLLGHLCKDIIWFGSLVGVATEIFKSFNAIFWYCSILSNHMAPSCDIAHQLSAQETVKYIFSGGWWLSDSGEWQQLGTGVQNYVKSQPFLRHLCGWTVDADNSLKFHPGTIQLEALKQHPDNRNIKIPGEALAWGKTHGAWAVNIPSLAKDIQVVWHWGKHVIAQSQDILMCLVLKADLLAKELLFRNCNCTEGSQDSKQGAAAHKAAKKKKANPNPQKSKKQKQAGKDQECEEEAMDIDCDVDDIGNKLGDNEMSDMQ
ncbi:hypothetical protein B0H34DRAFT_843892 [Crassisporium funariophilum]|nr:hypothetical protein B0H34DRAFT_843892 [Crassisporium funariophilum]